ncbi:hypothetical protein KSP39_PZI007897 [Platanthera zijinensis]|uniref:Uncharacterized protein n=1 Tax=Platanthera zijinensis TaxID=2320716 RepID=A0AAP0G8M4_9ASPA
MFRRIRSKEAKGRRVRNVIREVLTPFKSYFWLRLFRHFRRAFGANAARRWVNKRGAGDVCSVCTRRKKKKPLKRRFSNPASPPPVPTLHFDPPGANATALPNKPLKSVDTANELQQQMRDTMPGSQDSVAAQTTEITLNDIAQAHPLQIPAIIIAALILCMGRPPRHISVEHR